MNNDNKTARELSLEWWNNMSHSEKGLYMEGEFKHRHPQSLTGREIEQIYLSEHPTQPEQTIKEETEVYLLEGITPGDWNFEEHDDWSEYAGNIVATLGKNESGMTNIRTIDCLLKYTDTVEEAKANGRIMASAPRLAQENKELKEQVDKMANELRRLRTFKELAEDTIKEKEEENKLLREALKDLIFNADPSTTSGRTDLEKSIKEAKAAINQ